MDSVIIWARPLPDATFTIHHSSTIIQDYIPHLLLHRAKEGRSLQLARYLCGFNSNGPSDVQKQKYFFGIFLKGKNCVSRGQKLYKYKDRVSQHEPPPLWVQECAKKYESYKIYRKFSSIKPVFFQLYP